jgi:hypothetical protein
LIKDLSVFVAELTILLGPLQIQINILKQWENLENVNRNHASVCSFEDAIEKRNVHVGSLKRLLEQAKELQALVCLRTEPLVPYSLLIIYEAISA